MLLVKVCADCGEEKSINDFYLRDGRPRSACKPCWAERTKRDRVANPERFRAYGRGSYARNNRYWYHVKTEYGLTQEQYQTMWEEQQGCCAACRSDFDVRPHVDHDHTTGVVRGLLCAGCNKALGHTKDDVTRLRALIAYLERPC